MPAEVNYKSGTRVLSKMPSYPAWPGKVVPMDLIPANILKGKPKDTTRNLCVKYIGDETFYWNRAKDLAALDEEMIQLYLEVNKAKRKKNPQLFAAYELALTNPSVQQLLNVEEISDTPRDDDEEDEEDEEDEGELEEEPEGEEDEEDEAERAAKDEEEVEEVEEGAERARSRRSRTTPLPKQDSSPNKRTRAQRSSSGTETPQPERKKALKASHKREAKALDTVSTKITTTSKTIGSLRGSAVKSPLSESAPRSGATPASHEDRRKQLWFFRSKLQKGLVQRPSHTPLTKDELETAVSILDRLVGYPMDIQLLKSTKIHKVLKALARSEISLDGQVLELEPEVVSKSGVILVKWADLISEIRTEKEGGLKMVPSSPDSAPLQHTLNTTNADTVPKAEV